MQKRLAILIAFLAVAMLIRCGNLPPQNTGTPHKESDTQEEVAISRTSKIERARLEFDALAQNPQVLSPKETTRYDVDTQACGAWQNWILLKEFSLKLTKMNLDPVQIGRENEFRKLQVARARGLAIAVTRSRKSLHCGSEKGIPIDVIEDTLRALKTAQISQENLGHLPVKLRQMLVRELRPLVPRVKKNLDSEDLSEPETQLGHALFQWKIDPAQFGLSSRETERLRAKYGFAMGGLLSPHPE